MKIGIALPSQLFLQKNSSRIFAPRELFLILAELLHTQADILAYVPPDIPVPCPSSVIRTKFDSDNDYISVKDKNISSEFASYSKNIRETIEYELLFVSEILKRIDHDHIDILHIYMSYYSLYLLEQSPIPVCVTLHDPQFPPETIESLRLTQQFNNIFFIPISRNQSSSYENSPNLHRLDPVYHGIIPPENSYSTEQEDYISFAGRIIKEKGLDIAIDAAKSINKPLKIVTSSNYTDNKYYETSIKPRLNTPLVTLNNASFTHMDKYAFFRKSKAMVFPILWEEPFGMVQIEAMAAGTPVVAFAQGSTPEIIRDGKTGFLVHVSDQDKRGNWTVQESGLQGIIKALEMIFSMSEEEYQVMRKSAREHVQTVFSAGRMSQEYLKRYAEALKNSNTQYKQA